MGIYEDMLSRVPLGGLGGSMDPMAQPGYVERLREQHAQNIMSAMQQVPMSAMTEQQRDSFASRAMGDPYRRAANVETRNPAGTLALIKKSIKEIKAEAVGEEAQARVQTKINRLEKLGVTAQAEVLRVELQVRVKLMRVQEWDYKVLPFAAIEEFVKEHRNWDGIGGHYDVHIDLLKNYCGTKKAVEAIETEAKDKIIPDDVLDELETAKGRQVFDQYSVLRVEKVKDPLLLGSIDGCKDYFLIAEWGEDVSFDDIVKD